MVLGSHVPSNSPLLGNDLWHWTSVVDVDVGLAVLVRAARHRVTIRGQIGDEVAFFANWVAMWVKGLHCDEP